MTRHLLITLIALAVSALTSTSQVPAALEKLFDGPYTDNPSATETIITGDPLKPFSLNLFHSLSVKDNATLADEIEKAVRSDGKRSLWKETVMNGGRLQNGIYELKGNKRRRYILYLNTFISGGNDATVIYLEGSATPSQIKRLISTISN
ncbi:MAG: DUF6108 family protein [Pseudoflavonifractor sp.]|nr:DUF6108 family protein [Alloprevotella sp.]MCM1117212.1 DUF6108 family protein [Pseudoflavonifractor sp.]